jgi:hypothetical protein
MPMQERLASGLGCLEVDESFWLDGKVEDVGEEDGSDEAEEERRMHSPSETSEQRSMSTIAMLPLRSPE